MSGESNVIDLTESFSLIDHCQLTDVVIELDDSLEAFSPNSPVLERRKSLRKPSSAKNKSSGKPKKIKKKSLHSPIKETKASKGIGDCPVCWDELGKTTLASTKCGHVFCLHCIEQVVKLTKSCPTCRHALKGASAYHPIYLSLH